MFEKCSIVRFWLMFDVRFWLMFENDQFTFGNEHFQEQRTPSTNAINQNVRFEHGQFLAYVYLELLQFNAENSNSNDLHHELAGKIVHLLTNNDKVMCLQCLRCNCC